MRCRKTQLWAIVNDAANMGIAKMQADGTCLSTFCFSIGLLHQLDGMLSAVIFIISFLFINCASVAGLTEFYFLHFGNTCSLAAIY